MSATATNVLQRSQSIATPCSYLDDRLFNIGQHAPLVQPYNRGISGPYRWAARPRRSKIPAHQNTAGLKAAHLRGNIRMSLPASLKDRLELPVLGSPLFIVSGPEPVIAQCKAGIVGSFPALNARPVEKLDELAHPDR